MLHWHPVPAPICLLRPRPSHVSTRPSWCRTEASRTDRHQNEKVTAWLSVPLGVILECVVGSLLRRLVVPVAVVAVVFSLLGAASAVGSVTPGGVDSGLVARVAGSDRFESAVEVATLVGGGSLAGLDRLIVVSGETAFDGLAASGLAGFLDDGGRSGRTAMLLTRSGSLPVVVRDAVRASGVAASEVVVVGGVAAVSDAVRVAVAVAAGWDGVGVNPVVRIAGEDQYGTAAAIVEYVTSVAGGNLPVSYRTVLVAGGEGFFDALAAGALAYRNGHLLLLSSPLAAPLVTLDAVAGLRANCVVMIGGTTALAPTVATQMSAVVATGGCGVERIGGADRYDTAVQVADRFIAANGSPRQPVLVSGVGFADGLTAAPLAGGDRPLLFTAPDQLSGPTSSWLRQHRNSIQEVLVLGGTSAVSATIANQTNQALTPLPAPPPPPTVPPVLSLSYASSTFTQGQASQVVSPTLTGAIGSTTFSATGQLPPGVTFNATTGAFTGPAAWNFNATTISAGSNHTCAVLTDTTARCWGDNGSDRLGDGTTTPSPLPVTVVDTGVGTTLSGITHISAGANHTCAVVADTTARCWGLNSSGQLGNGANTPSSLPVTVVDTGVGTTLSGITHISVGTLHTCAVLADTTARCWGNNGSGRLGDGTTTNRSVPVTVVNTAVGTTLSGITHISAGSAHTCAVVADTTARCWGRNLEGQLGDNTTTFSPLPVTVVDTGVGTALSGITHISAGSAHTCAVLADTTARCWGTNRNGQLGDNTIIQREIPVTVTTSAGTALSGVTQIVAGGEHACALLVGGTAHCWGWNDFGQLGDDTNTSSSVPVTVTTSAGTALSGITHISAGSSQNCAVLDDGTARCWGSNGSGRLGDGTTVDSPLPVTVLNIGKPGWPAIITVVATDSAGRTSSVDVTLTYQ
jgi:alpha-tubulin suppressor-like RCC1 family protein/putative cell wall-binding protein